VNSTKHRTAQAAFADRLRKVTEKARRLCRMIETLPEPEEATWADVAELAGLDADLGRLLEGRAK
jgi:alkylated DNA nucleotide flippase Atl1